jgi:hypothetical protein
MGIESKVKLKTLTSAVLIALNSAFYRVAEAQPVPPCNLSANTPASYNLIVALVAQQQSNWCWTASCGMLFA